MKYVKLLALALALVGCDSPKPLAPELSLGVEPAAAPVGAVVTATVEVDEFAATSVSGFVSSDSPAILEASGPDRSSADAHPFDIDAELGMGMASVPFQCVARGTATLTAMAGDQRTGSRAVECTDTPRETRVADSLGDFIDSISDLVASRREPHADLVGGQVHCIGDSSVLDTVAPCGDGAVCGELEPTGPVLVAELALAAPLPEAPDHFLAYTFLAQRDDDPANDWLAQEPFDWDLFQQFDSWLGLVFDPTVGWNLMLQQVDGDQSIAMVPSAARAVYGGRSVLFYIPASELGDPCSGSLGFGMAAFAAGDSSYPEDDRGGDVLGPDPTGAPSML